MLVKNSSNKKGYIGFVGSQPMLLLFDACRLNIWCKSNNIGCDPTNPMYPFLFEEFFTNTCHHKKNKKKKKKKKTIFPAGVSPKP